MQRGRSFAHVQLPEEHVWECVCLVQPYERFVSFDASFFAEFLKEWS